MRTAELDPTRAGLEHRGHVLRDRGWPAGERETGEQLVGDAR